MEPKLPPDLREVLKGLTNAELMAGHDLFLLELEKRLLRYARAGHDLLEMADEGLVLAARLSARLSQASSAAAHTAGHLQIVGIGDWRPSRTEPGWSDDARVLEGEEPHEHY